MTQVWQRIALQVIKGELWGVPAAWDTNMFIIQSWKHQHWTTGHGTHLKKLLAERKTITTLHSWRSGPSLSNLIKCSVSRTQTHTPATPEGNSKAVHYSVAFFFKDGAAKSISDSPFSPQQSFICVEKQEPDMLETWEYFTVSLWGVTACRLSPSAGTKCV